MFTDTKRVLFRQNTRHLKTHTAGQECPEASDLPACGKLHLCLHSLLHHNHNYITTRTAHWLVINTINAFFHHFLDLLCILFYWWKQSVVTAEHKDITSDYKGLCWCCCPVILLLGFNFPAPPVHCLSLHVQIVHLCSSQAAWVLARPRYLALCLPRGSVCLLQDSRCTLSLRCPSLFLKNFCLSTLRATFIMTDSMHTAYLFKAFKGIFLHWKCVGEKNVFEMLKFA